MLMGIGREEGAKDSDLCTFASRGKNNPIKKAGQENTLATSHSVSSATGRPQTIEMLKLRRAWFSIRYLLRRLLFVQVFGASLRLHERLINHVDEAQMNGFIHPCNQH
jgi:hypothetical protein